MIPLHVAAKSDHYEIVEEGDLVGKKTIDIKDKNGVNMCDYAVG